MISAPRAASHGSLNAVILRAFARREGEVAELESDRAALRDRLLAAVPRWQKLIASFDDARFAAASTLDYTTTKGIAQSLPFAPTLGHVFNHATHHRGQITAAITAMGYPCPVIDRVWMLQAQSKGRAR